MSSSSISVEKEDHGRNSPWTNVSSFFRTETLQYPSQTMVVGRYVLGLFGSFDDQSHSLGKAGPTRLSGIYLAGPTFYPQKTCNYGNTHGVLYPLHKIYRQTDSMPWPRMLCFDVLVLKILHWSLSILWYRWTFQSEI